MNAAGMASPTCPLFSIETRTPARPPVTLETWFSVSDTENAEDLISSPISRCTIESCASLARPAQQVAANATSTAAASPKNQAHAAAAIGAIVSIEYRIACGARARSTEPTAMAVRLPADTPATMAPSARLWETPKWPLRNTKARKKST